MAVGCGAISRGSSADCNNIPDGGTRARLILFNFADVLNIVEDDDNNVTDIELVDGATGYEFLGFRNDVKKSEEVIKPDTGIAKFKHAVGFVVYENTQIQKNNIENIVRGLFIAVVENKGKNDNVFEVVGGGVGLSIVAGPIRNAHENGGFFVISLATPDDEGDLENHLPQTLLIAETSGQTQYEANLAFLESLLPTS